MQYLIWTLPTLAVIGVIASGKGGVLAASVFGLVLSLAVALIAAPAAFPLSEAVAAMARGAWIGWVVVPYILGGLLFWQMAIRHGDAAMPVETPSNRRGARRRLLFTACFLIGPFAESATGFGIGIIGTMMLVRRLNVPVIYLLALSLLSQTMILWGGMGSSSIVAGAYARTDPVGLAVHASLIVVAFNALWLPLFWRMAERAGVPARRHKRASEAFWLAGCMGLTIGATAFLGPEVAMLAAYGPLIVLRYLLDERPDRARLRTAFSRMLPFTLLIGWLVAIRLFPPVSVLLESTLRLKPFEGAPAWSPLHHAGTWLVVAALLTAILRRHTRHLGQEIRDAWKTGRLAVLTIVIFSMMAELLSGSGIASGQAVGIFEAMGDSAILLTPLLSALFGALGNSSNVANGLFMASQASLATEAGLSLPAVLALQQASALSLNMVGPVRISIVCSLAAAPGREREIYRVMLPFAAAAIAVLMAVAALVSMRIL